MNSLLSLFNKNRVQRPNPVFDVANLKAHYGKPLAVVVVYDRDDALDKVKHARSRGRMYSNPVWVSDGYAIGIWPRDEAEAIANSPISKVARKHDAYRALRKLNK